jgi:1,4-alpha-glucan branching enzyme
MHQSLLTEFDVYLFTEGTHCRLYEKLGAQLRKQGTPEAGTQFSVWAPAAEGVSLIADFNGWNPDIHPLRRREDQSGIWETWVSGVGSGHLYKYHIATPEPQRFLDKSDPFAFAGELAPSTASVICDLSYAWSDEEWMRGRAGINAIDGPISIYEVHLGSWRRVPEENFRFLSYREMAPLLANHVRNLGFTHVELMPVMEHALYESWGYQLTGYYAATSRFGSPADLMFLIDYLHQRGIGVILDWVPSHFSTNDNGLMLFDGTHLFEHPDPLRGFHPIWKTAIFNYGRPEVRAFLISNALFWLDRYHADALRVDGVASMLYLNHEEAVSLREGDPGGINDDAVRFLQKLNEAAYLYYGDIHTIAEESDTWPHVSVPTYAGGLGFGMKWNMGWMHDVLFYLGREPGQRSDHHDELIGTLNYAFTENFVLSLSHDEVTRGKNSLLGKMPGSEHERFANLRLLLGLLFAHPGKKLLFMQNEFGQQNEWDPSSSLDWHLLHAPLHEGIFRWVSDCASLYRGEPSCHQLDFHHEGFEWIDCSDRGQCVVSFLRWDRTRTRPLLVVCNFSNQHRTGYDIGVPYPGPWREMLNSNASEYGGTGEGNQGMVHARNSPFHGRTYSVRLILPRLSILFFVRNS